MQVSSVKKMSSPKNIDVPLVRKIRRLYHIKSVPSYTINVPRKESQSKLESQTKDEHEVKIRRFKTHQFLKYPPTGNIKTTREKSSEWARKKEQSSQPSKSLTKSTTYRSPNPDRSSQKRGCKGSKQKGKKNLKKMYSGILNRAREVVE